MRGKRPTHTVWGSESSVSETYVHTTLIDMVKYLMIDLSMGVEVAVIRCCVDYLNEGLSMLKLERVGVTL
jgi:hypothetical protein